METRKLYDEDAYAASFEAVVLSCRPAVLTGKERGKSKNAYELILDQTLFFPEEGGQSPDRGTIGGINVSDVQISNGRILHYVEEAFEEGSRVSGQIDWDHRFNNMQQHSGEHILSGLIYRKYGYENVGFHLSDQIVTLDTSGPLTGDQIEELEWEANRVIAENRRVRAEFPDRESLKTISYRSKKEIEGRIRLVTIEDCDVCACCAPHVKRTGEIGLLKVMSAQNYKGGVRLSILCGFRALEAFRGKDRILSGLAGMYSTDPEKLTAIIEKQREEAAAQKAELFELKKQLFFGRLEKELEDQKTSVFLLFAEDLDRNVMREGLNYLMEKEEGFIAIFSGSDQAGYRFMVGSSTEDCRPVADRLRKTLGAKGGGSSRMIQGSLGAGEQEIRRMMEDL